MKQFMLAIVLIAVPVGLFSVYESRLPRQAEASQTLGDLSDFKSIVADVQKIAATGDFAAAEKRATDFETLWDDKEASLRPMNPEAWGNIDDAADAVFGSLRHGTPTASKVDTALAGLTASLNNTGATAGKPGSPTLVDGIAVTDASGHAIPCEEMIAKLKEVADSPNLSQADKAKTADFLSKALERCNADDDQRADALSAHGIALATK